MLPEDITDVFVNCTEESTHVFEKLKERTGTGLMVIFIAAVDLQLFPEVAVNEDG